MEAVVLIGIQGAGKSSFYRERFFDSHVRINLDMLKTRFRQRTLLEACLQAKQKYVVDNTNLTVTERLYPIQVARSYGFETIGFYFRSHLKECLARNAARPESQRVPDKAVLGASGRLELPSYEEGFDQLYYVAMQGQQFAVEQWRDEV